jgi:hypothetical protein
MKVKIISREWLNDVEFYLYSDVGDGIAVAAPVSLVLTKHFPGSQLSNPTFTLPYSGAIEFVDSVIEEARFSYLGSGSRYKKENILESEEIKILKEELADWKKLALTLLGAG